MPSEKAISVIVPARNEEALIARTIEAILQAASPAGPPSLPHLANTETELIVVDNDSSDRTAAIAETYVRQNGISLINCRPCKAPCARNMGANLAQGRILVFVDADTIIPPDTLGRVRQHVDQGYRAGISRLASLEPSRQAWWWWWFWGQVRRLPLPLAKAMPAFMFCTREVYHSFGPFDERVRIGEEWPILAGLYRVQPQAFIYDRSLIVLTSSRRMNLQRFGYLRTFGRYIWAVVHHSGRYDYSDGWRHPQGAGGAGELSELELS